MQPSGEAQDDIWLTHVSVHLPSIRISFRGHACVHQHNFQVELQYSSVLLFLNFKICFFEYFDPEKILVGTENDSFQSDLTVISALKNSTSTHPTRPPEGGMLPANPRGCRALDISPN